MLLDAELLKKTGIFALVSSELVATVGGGYLAGQWLDGHLNSAPVFVGLLTLVGLSYSVWRIRWMARRWMVK